jgi:polygalacturonase
MFRQLVLCSSLLAIASAVTAQNALEPIAPIKAPFAMPQLQRPEFPNRAFSITKFGAKQCQWDADEIVKSTEAIQKAINACHASGGGYVAVPGGDWITGSLTLKSNVNLHIAEGATLHFTNDLEDYLPIVHVRYEGVEAYNYAPLIYAPNCENIAVTGRGVLNGHGHWWWKWFEENNPGDRVAEAKVPLDQRDYGKGGGREGMRPTFIVPWKSKNILIEGVTLKDSPMWNVHPVYSENIIVRGITVQSLDTPNGDGVVPDSCRNVLIENNHLETGDDAVVVKSGLNEDGMRIGIPSENIVVRNFTARDVRTGSGGIVFGSETSGGIRNIYVTGGVFDGCDRGIRFKTTRGRGNVIENIYVENVEMKNIERQAINFNSYYEQDATGKSPQFRNVYINNVKVDGAKAAIEMVGLPEKWLENIQLKNVAFTNVEEGVVAHRVKDLLLDGITIQSSERPITLDDVFEAAIRVDQLSGKSPPIVIEGDESGAITIEGISPDDVECGEEVAEGSATVEGDQLP